MTDVVPPAGRLVIVRHGRTAWNASRRFQGQADIPLEDLGRSQAAAVGAVLAAAGFVPSVFVCSDLGRAVETAAIIGSAIGATAVPDARLREIELGTWQGLDTSEAAAAFPDEYAGWRAGHDIRRGGGETYAEVAVRAVACVASLDVSGVALLVTHGGTARALIGQLAGLPHDAWSSIGPLGNCRISVLGAAASRGWRLAVHNAADLGS